MTVTQLLQRIHSLYEGDTSYPEASSDDYSLRLALLNNGVDVHADEPHEWEELYSEDATQTTVSGTNSYDKPDDYRRPTKSRYLKIAYTAGTLYYRYVSKKKAMQLLANGKTSDRFYWFAGTKFYISPTPDETSKTITLPYIADPDYLVDTTDVPQLTRPLFLVYYVLSVLYEQDLRTDMVTYYQSKAAEQMSYMVEDVEIDQLEEDGSESAGFGV